MKIQEKNYRQVMDWIREDQSEIVSFLSRLVRCKTPSTTGDTREAVELIKGYFEKENLPYDVFASCKTMPNIISSFEGANAGRHLMFNGHLDVMPAGKEPGWIDNPWSGAIREGRVWGRGTLDMKAGVTAMIFAYKYLYRMRDRVKGRLSISLVADEETGWGRGTGFLFSTVPERMNADCVLSGEPSGIGAISFASKGFMMLTVKIKTRGAIAGYSDDSKNAIEIAADVIRDLKQLESINVELPEEINTLLRDDTWLALHKTIRGENEAKQLKKITVDVCTIKGGSLSVVIPSDCCFTVSVVFPQGTDVDLLTKKVNEISDKYAEATLHIDGIDMPDMSDKNGELPSIIQSVAEGIGLKRPVLTPDIAISDCRYWRYKGIPAYWFGPGGENCSAANENVLIEDLLNTVRIHTITALEYLQNK